jgi:hypothetical protein
VQAYRGFESLPLRHLGTELDTPDAAGFAPEAALAEASATPHEIMAVTGHQTLKEIERYTKAASRKITGNAAMAKLG